MDLIAAKQQMAACANTVTPMPVYQSHKLVSALKIKQVLLDLDGSGIIVPANVGYAPFAVSAEYMGKHKPEAGGYFVQYKDGYRSYSPAVPFEEGYKQNGHTGSDFAQDMAGIGWALKQLRNGSKVCRTGWNGKGMHLALQVPDEHSKMTLPYIYMFTAQGDLVPWLASQTDLLATDWEIAE